MPVRSGDFRGFLRAYVIPSLVLIGILVVWDLTKPRMPRNPPQPVLRQEERPNGGVPPWNAHEDLAQSNRDALRRSAQQALDRAWSTFCDRQGREKLTQALSQYFGLRRVQEKNYPERWDKEGETYIAHQWATADDQRIERLVQELYGRGYLKLTDFKPFVAERVAPLVKDTRVISAPCKN